MFSEVWEEAKSYQMQMARTDVSEAELDTKKKMGLIFNGITRKALNERWKANSNRRLIFKFSMAALRVR